MSKRLAYTAPEVIINAAEKYGPALDYWSLGIIAYELATGVRPFVPHLPLAQWVLRVRDKKSEHISIYETNDGEMVYSNRMWSSNQLSNGFVVELERWLRLALEWNPKQRGCIFEKIRKKSNDSSVPSDMAHPPPIQMLKFFDTIDDVLLQKMLTIFTLTNHKLISMPATECTTMNDLYAFIEQKASIPAGTCHLTAIVDGRNLINCCDQSNKPIDFYRDDCTDRPMIFVTQIISNASNGTIDTNVFPTDIPITVQNVLKNPEKSLKPHALCRFACDALHFIRMENRLFKTGLNGWFLFAEQLNHAIEQRCHVDVRHMQSSIYGLIGALDLFKMTMQMAIDQQSTITAFDNVTKIEQNLDRLRNACDKIALRYSSLCRRSREICQHALFAKRNVHDFYDVNQLTKAYASLHSQIARNQMPSKPHFELFQCIFKCLKQRDNLLSSNGFCELKRYDQRF